jgi:hypothetical protein
VLDDEGDRSAVHRLRCEVVAVRTLPRDGEEERAGTDRTRVVGKIAHLDPAAEHLHRLERCDEALQVHLGDSSSRVLRTRSLG